jgi:hypothetical protein
MYEQRHHPLLPWPRYLQRLLTSSAIGLLLIAVSLGAGMIGYHALEHLSWIDAFDNAAMILSGMGPLSELHTTGAKLFAGIYALYSGIILIFVAGIIFAPVVHRFLHRFHLESDSPSER